MKDESESLGSIVKMKDKKSEEIKEVREGEIDDDIGMKEVKNGEKMCEKDEKIIMESMELNEKVI